VTLRYGGWEIQLLDCGSLDLPAEALGPGFDDPTPTPVFASLWRGHGRTALVDAGSGPFDELWPGCAGLTAALERAGVAPAEITDVVLTHFDFDHAGGAVDGSLPDSFTPAFGSVPVRLLDVDLDYWPTAEGGRLLVGPRILHTLRDAGVLETFADGAEVLPGVLGRSAPGHCPGHCVLEVAGDEGVLLSLSDVIHHPLHVEHPEWDHLYDRRPEEALATRTALLAEAEARGAVILASHIESPGRIARRDGSATWVDVS
jgi:glyoxylase-like metal-dependent hydrolase (beta-lactamase superfamily II)